MGQRDFSEDRLSEAELRRLAFDLIPQLPRHIGDGHQVLTFAQELLAANFPDAFETGAEGDPGQPPPGGLPPGGPAGGSGASRGSAGSGLG